ncbi:DUF5133 domain-containing protein [Streptomyces flavidovirens]|uniref:DUF5133 domain-containing protein n=1 Tax=Streptomyces flavidovirens TaxID=67298 RepID=A0ABW6RMM9_9ACTN
MLMAHPAVLSRLIEKYEALKVLHVEACTPDVQQRLGDVAYTLCVSTGTGDIDSALVSARHQLAGTRPEDNSLLAT